MFHNAKASELVAVLDSIDPASLATGATNGAWISAARFANYLAVINTGVLGTSATVDAKLQQATTAAGGGTKTITGKEITQIVKATGDNKVVMINLRPQDLDVEGGFGFFRLQVTVGTAASLVQAQVLGVNPMNASAAAYDEAAVVQIV